MLLSLDRYPIDPEEKKIHETINLVFTFIFLFELIFKICGLGFKIYLIDIYNKFDAIIVLVSLVDFTISYVVKINAGEALTAVRAFRLLRVFKLAKSWEKFRFLLATIIKTVKDMRMFAVLLGVFVYVCALLGVNLFAYKVKLNSDGLPIPGSEPGGVYPDSNFNNVLEAFLSVFIVLVNDGWSTICFQHTKAARHHAVGYAYFVCLLMLGQFVMLNLFLAILLGNFD